MPYQPNVPQAADQLSQSQPAILGNFQAIGGMLDLTVGANALKLDRTGAIPPTAATSVGLYGADSILAPGATALFFRAQNNGVSTDMTSALKAGNGWTCLPSGILLQWGIANINNSTVVNFPIAFPNHAYTVTLTPVGVGQINIVKLMAAPLLASFTASSNRQSGGATEAVNVYFLAVGD